MLSELIEITQGGGNFILCAKVKKDWLSRSRFTAQPNR